MTKNKNSSRINRNDSRVTILICVALTVVTLIVYWQVTHFELLSFDDEIYVSGNDFVKNGINTQGLRQAFQFDGYAGNWHPITWLSLMLDSDIYSSVSPTGAVNAAGYHLTNLLFHIANTLLLFAFATRLTSSIWRGGFVAGLFAIHPLHVESVAWVAERKDVLSTFFWLLTTMVYLSYAKQKSGAKYVLLVCLFALGLMSKPMLVTLPITLLLLDVWPLHRFDFTATSRNREKSKQEKLKDAQRRSAPEKYRVVIEKIPLFVMSVLASVATIAMQRKGGAVSAIHGITLGRRLATACVACVTYLIKTVWPHHLAPVYPYPVRQDLTGIAYTISPILVGACALVLTAITFAAIVLGRRVPYLFFGWMWYLVTLIPVLGFIQVGYQSWADRYTYVPLIGIFVILASGIPDLLVNKLGWLSPRALIAGGVAVIGILACVAHAQATWWHDNKKLYYHTLDITSDNWFVRNALGRLLLKEDENLIGAEGPSFNAYKVTEEAVDHLQKGIEIDAGIADIHNNLGVAYRALSLFPAFGEVPAKRLQDATDQFEDALRMDPKLYDASLNLGMTLSQLGKQDEAAAVYQRLLQLSDLPPSAAYWARVNLSAILFNGASRSESIRLLNEAVEINAHTGVDASNQASQRLQQIGASQN